MSDERWCERDQRFFNDSEWSMHIMLCDGHPLHAELKRLQEEVERLRTKAELADDMRWSLAALLMACTYTEGGEAHRTAEALIVRYDALRQAMSEMQTPSSSV